MEKWTDTEQVGSKRNEEPRVSFRAKLLRLKEECLALGGIQEKAFDRKCLFVLLIFSFLIRIPLLIYPEVIYNDATEYIANARRILSWDWSAGRTHPFYPSLIALFHFLTPNDEIAGILVSVIFGALLILPVFYLGKAIFNEKVGIISALFATVHPFLYTPSGSVLSESIFHFLLASSVLFGWYAFRQGRFKDILLFGLFASLSYLTRPEGMGFLFIFGAWVLFIRPPGERRGWAKRIGILLLAIISFLIISTPYFMQLKRETGRWQISKKISIAMGSLSEEESAEAVETIRLSKKMTFSSFIKAPLTVAKRMAGGLLESLNGFQQVFTPFLCLVLIAGFVISKGRTLSLKGNLYLVSYIVYLFCFIHPFFRVNRRYTSHVISICLPWAAFGFIEIVNWVHRRFEKHPFQKKFPVLFLVFILITLFIQGRVIHPREHRVIQREAGYWMKDHLPKGGKLMSPLPQEAFYAELTWVRMPVTNVDTVLEEARSKRVQYLVIDEDMQKESPGFMEKTKRGDLVLIKEWKGKRQNVLLFQMVYP